MCGAVLLLGICLHEGLVVTRTSVPMAQLCQEDPVPGMGSCTPRF